MNPSEVLVMPEWLKRYDEDIARRLFRQYHVEAFPLAGHAGDCERVTKATITGDLTGRCTCGVAA